MRLHPIRNERKERRSKVAGLRTFQSEQDVGLSMASERFLSGSGFALWVSEADGAFDGAVGGGFGGGRVVVHLVSAL
jgi:hypothetical protein